MKWAVVGNHFTKERYEFLSKFLTDKGYENECEFVAVDQDNLFEQLEEAKQEYEQIRLERPFRDRVVDHLDSITVETKYIRSADCLVQSIGTWWPRSTLYTSVTRLVASRLKTVDLSGGVLVVGTGASARAGIAAFTRIGFSHINITDRNEERGRELVEKLKKIYFNGRFEFTPQNRIGTLPGTHEILFNTTPNVSENDILEDLYFFNFMKPGGVVIDSNLLPLDGPLIQEARSVGARVVEGSEMASWSDVVWWEMCSAKGLDFDEYFDALTQALSSDENDKKVDDKT